MKRRSFFLFTLFTLFGCALPIQGSPILAEEDEESFVVLGWLEEASLTPGDLTVHAKLDTGADTSSLHAEKLKIVRKGDKEWATFEVTNRHGEKASFRRKIRRYADIKRKKGESQSRPVVKLGICVGNAHEVVEFTLVDRSNFSSAALIGRNFLSGKILVDSSNSYTTVPECKANTK